MGKSRRERIERIIRGEEQSIRDREMDARKHQGVSEGMVSKAESLAKKVIDKTVGRKWAKMDLPGQVAVAQKMMRMTGMVNFRANFLKEGNFPQDIRNKLDKGESRDQVWGYYWSCPEFVAFWKSMAMDEDALRHLVYGGDGTART